MAKYPAYPKDLALRVYTSQLIGSNNNLVLHGGGNTSVKVRLTNIVGEEQEIVYVKGSGVDLKAIEPKGFVGLDRFFQLKLRNVDNLSDEEMEHRLQIHKVGQLSINPLSKKGLEEGPW